MGAPARWWLRTIAGKRDGAPDSLGALARRFICEIREEQELLDRRPALQRATVLRSPYGDPMHLMQVDLLRRWRAGGRQDAALFDALLASVSGIALALQATG